MYKLSIITINYNNADGLERTIKSVIAQSFGGFEYIVIDGGSTDLSVEIIKKYSAKINYWVSEKDNGIYNAMNKGIKVANGQYCLFLNSGDYLYNDIILEHVFSQINNEDIIYGDMMIDRGRHKLEYGSQPSKITFDFMVATTVWHPVSFIKKILFDKYGLYNEDLKIISDYEFFLKTILVEGVSTKYISLAISVFNTSGIGSTNQYELLQKAERKFVLEKYFNKEVIDTAHRFNALKESKAVVISNQLNENRFFKTIFSSFYYILRGFKNRFKK